MLPMTELYVANFTSMQGRRDEAEKLFEPLRSAPPSEDARNRARLHTLYGRHLIRCGELERAGAELAIAREVLGDIRRGTWDSHPDDVIVAFIELARARGDAEGVAKYERLRVEARGL